MSGIFAEKEKALMEITKIHQKLTVPNRLFYTTFQRKVLGKE